MPEREAPTTTAGLLERAKAGDEGAFERLFARSVARLEWFVRVRTGARLASRVEVEDVLQETYAAAWAKLAALEPRGEGAFARWLFALAEHRIRRFAEHHGAERRSPRREAGPADAALALAADPSSGPCTRADRAEARERTARALLALDEDLRDVLLARLVEERPLAEIAAESRRSESAVRRLVVKATEALGRELARRGLRSAEGGEASRDA